MKIKNYRYLFYLFNHTINARLTQEKIWCKSVKSRGFILAMKSIFVLIIMSAMIYAANFDQLFQEGKTLSDSGKYAEAVVKYEAAVKAKSKNPDANYGLGYAYYKTGNFEKAIKSLKNAQKFLFDAVKVHHTLAEVYQAMGDKETAISEYYEAIKIAPKSSLGHAKLADLYLEQRSINLAEQEYNTALKYDSLFVPAIVGQANILKYQRKYPEAMRLFDKAKKIDSTYAPIYLSLGRLYSELNTFNKAVVELNKYIQLEPSDPEGYKILAEIYTQFKNYVLAINNTKLAMQHGDTSAGSLRFLGYLYLRNRQPKEAKDALLQAVLRTGDDVNIWVDLGKAYLLIDSGRPSVDAFSKAFALDSFSVGNYAFDFGNAYYKIAKYDSSVMMFTRKIISDTMAIGAYINRGYSYILLKKYDEAVRDLKQGIKLKPTDVQSHLVLGQIYAFLKDQTKDASVQQSYIKQAKAEFNTVLKLDPKNKEAKDGLGKLTVPVPVFKPENIYTDEEEENEGNP